MASLSVRRRTVLFANHSGLISGAEASLLALVRALHGSAFGRACACPPASPLFEALRSAGCEPVSARFRRLHKTWNPAAIAAYGCGELHLVSVLCRAIRRTRACLLHSNSTTAHLAGGVAAKRMGIPSIWHVRDLAPLGPLGYFLGRMSDKIVAISQAVARSVRCYANANQIEVVHNGIDADSFAAQARPGALRAELNLAPNAALVGMVAQMAPWKGHRVFLDAVHRVSQRLPNVNAVLVGADLFGYHTDYAAELHRRQQEAGLSETVRFLGYRRDVPTVMADLDVLVAPSFDEPFGRVALEAMALGKPVVASDTGGLPEVVAHEVTGRICREGDAAAFASAVAELLTDKARAAQLGAAGRERVAQLFSAERMARRMTEIYEELADAHRH